MDTVWSGSFSAAVAVNVTVLSHADSKGAMLESMSEATQVLAGNDGLHTGALL
jgi:hypothetical protein